MNEKITKSNIPLNIVQSVTNNLIISRHTNEQNAATETCMKSAKKPIS